MKAFKLDGGYLVRLDAGEEIISSLSDFCAANSVRFATLSGIGAAGRVKLAAFDTKTKKYAEREFSGDLEIVSLSGNVTSVDSKPRIHAHACIAGHDLLAHGGHLVSAQVSVTCEITLVVSDVAITREKDERTGLMLVR